MAMDTVTNRTKRTLRSGILFLGLAAIVATIPTIASARDVEYKNEEVAVRVTPREPTQIQFPGPIVGGFKPKVSSVSIDKKDSDLIVFASERLSDAGEAIIVRLQDGRSYSLRIKRATAAEPRDDVVRIDDKGNSIISDDEEDVPPYKEKSFEYAPPTQVSGLMREMILVTEFGKKAVPGYRMTDRYKGQTVLHDGTMHAKIETIFIGPSLWGYVIDAENLLDQTQRLNPASFRIDGTRAVSAKDWELSPRPVNIEQQIANKHDTKVYIVTRSK